MVETIQTYILMHKEIPVAKIRLDSATASVSAVVELFDTAHIPVGIPVKRVKLTALRSMHGGRDGQSLQADPVCAMRWRNCTSVPRRRCWRNALGFPCRTSIGSALPTDRFHGMKLISLKIPFLRMLAISCLGTHPAAER